MTTTANTCLHLMHSWWLVMTPDDSWHLLGLHKPDDTWWHLVTPDDTSSDIKWWILMNSTWCAREQFDEHWWNLMDTYQMLHVLQCFVRFICFLWCGHLWNMPLAELYNINFRCQMPASWLHTAPMLYVLQCFRAIQMFLVMQPFVKEAIIRLGGCRDLVFKSRDRKAL